MKPRVIGVICALSLAMPQAGQAKRLDGDTVFLDSVTWGAKTWISKGHMKFDISSGSPFGDPTSTLKYEDLETNIFEINARGDMSNGVFARMKVGVGQLDEGTLKDKDYFSPETAQSLGGPEKFSDTRSSIEDDDAFYAGIDFGTSIYKNKRVNIDAYIGYQYWKEEYQAYGVTQLSDPYSLFGPDVGRNVKAITNEVSWDIFKVGLDSTFYITPKFDLGIDVAVIPYAAMENEDTHHLRTDLAQAPSIEMEGDGYGGEAEIDLTYHASKNLDLSIGARYWALYSDGDATFHASGGQKTKVKLNNLDSKRFGATAGINYIF